SALICEDRYQTRSTILTSQLPVARWHEQVGDPTAADGILDRLVWFLEFEEELGCFVQSLDGSFVLAIGEELQATGYQNQTPIALRKTSRCRSKARLSLSSRMLSWSEVSLTASRGWTIGSEFDSGAR